MNSPAVERLCMVSLAECCFSRHAKRTMVVIASLIFLLSIYLTLEVHNDIPDKAPAIRNTRIWREWLLSQEPRRRGQKTYDFYWEMWNKSQIVSTMSGKCEYPQPDPWDASIRHLIRDEPLTCTIVQPQGLSDIDDLGRLYLVDEAFNRAKKSHLANYVNASLTCYYQEFDRKDGELGGESDEVTFFKKFRFKRGERVVLKRSDFVNVSCEDAFNRTKYSMSHTHARSLVFKGHVTERTHKPVEIPPNIHIFGMDSMSRLNFIRKLPKTYSYLTDTLGGIVFKGLMNIGDNTYTNLNAFMTGKHVFGKELQELLRKAKNKLGERYHDFWPFVWKDYAKKGYVTMYNEFDGPSMKSTFNNEKKGFLKQPTDHYMRAFEKQVEMTDLNCKSSPRCYDAKFKYLYTVGYSLQFLRTYESRRPYFLFSWITDLSHTGDINLVANADQGLTDYFQKMLLSGHLNNTIFMVISDHGPQYAGTRKTILGRIEEIMPFFCLVMPKSMREKHPRVWKNIKGNTDKLISHYDVHDLLKDVSRYPESFEKQEGTSLLNGIFKETRSCQDARIPEDRCLCQRGMPLNMTDRVVKSVALAVVKHVNAMLKPFEKQCAVLSVKKISSAEITFSKGMTAKTTSLTNQDSSGLSINFKIMLEVNPSGGMLDATVKYRPFETHKEFEVLGDPSRINIYGNQSICIHFHELRKYCYCI